MKSRLLRSPTGKVVVVPLCYKQQLVSDGQDTNWSYIEIPVEEAEEWGPFLMGIVAHTRSESMTAYVRWKVVFWTSTDGRNWSTTPLDLFTEVGVAANNTDAVKSEYTSTGNFGLKMKFGLAVLNTTGHNTSIERAVVTVALAFKFLS